MIVGTGLVTGDAVILNTSELLVPPPGLTIEICAVPEAAILLAGTAAVTLVLLTSVVGNDNPFHSTVEPGTKTNAGLSLYASTVRMNAGPPAAALEGER